MGRGRVAFEKQIGPKEGALGSRTSEQAEGDANLFFYARHAGGRECQAAFFRFKRKAQTEFGVLFGGEAHDAHIKRVTIELVHGE